MDPFPIEAPGFNFLKYAQDPVFDVNTAIDAGIKRRGATLSSQYQEIQNARAQQALEEMQRQRAAEDAVAAGYKANPTSNLEAAYAQAAQIALANGDLDTAIKLDKAARESQFSALGEADLAAVNDATGIQLKPGTTLAGANLIQNIKNAQAMSDYRRQMLDNKDTQIQNLEKWRKVQDEWHRTGKPPSFKDWYTGKLLSGTPPTADEVAEFLSQRGSPAAAPTPPSGTPVPAPATQPRVKILGRKG